MDRKGCVRVVCPRCGSPSTFARVSVAEWSETYAKFYEYVRAYRALEAFLDRVFAELEASELEADRTVPSQGSRVLIPFGGKGARMK